LFVTADKFPPFRVDLRVLFVEELAGRGHEIHWVMPSERPRRRSGVESLGGGLAWVGACAAGDSRLAKARRQLQIFVNDCRALALIVRNRYDFVQVKDKFIAAAILLLAAKLTRTRFVYWLAYPFPEAWIEDSRSGLARHPLVAGFRGHVARWLLYRLILPRANLVFVQSARMKEDLASKGVPAARMIPVPMGVSAGLLQSAEGQKAKNIVSPSVLYLGSMYRVRHLETIVRAFRQVAAAIRAASLYFVGGEEQADIDFLREEARRLGIADRVVFTGALPREEAFAYVRAADVCLSPIFPGPILDVASPTKLVEYMAHAKPVIANDHPEQSQVIDASGGGLHVPWDESRFAEAMITLLSNPALAIEMGLKGRAYVEQHRRYSVIADRVGEAYLSMLGAATAAS
jgi:glycosyltransferase involved in cell wall biosynthesis